MVVYNYKEYGTDPIGIDAEASMREWSKDCLHGHKQLYF